jgi:hypothetical protein
MFTLPGIMLVALAVLLLLLAACYFMGGRQRTNHASRKGPDDR